MQIDVSTLESSEERVLIEDCFERRVAWLESEGVSQTVVYAELFEVPRVENEVAFSLGLGDTPEEVAERIAGLTGTDTVRLALWPDAIGVVAMHPRA
jgi:hypothetical protein